MKKKGNSKEVKEIIEKIKVSGLTYKKGAEVYGVKIKQQRFRPKSHKSF